MGKTILVIGGTGLLGQPTAKSLKATGFEVRLLTRDYGKARKLFDDSFELLSGDPTDLYCVTEALTGCYGVHISLPTEVELKVTEAVVKVADRKGVERISYVSGATVSEATRGFPFVNRKFMAEKAIRDSGVPYTIFCPTWVMESLALFVRQGRATVLGKQPYPFHWVAAEDCARMVMDAFDCPEAANQRFIILGPEAMLMKDALQRYCAALQPEIKQVSEMPFWLANLLATVTRNQELKGAGELMAYFEKVGEGHAPKLNPILGAPQTTLEMWFEKQKAKVNAAVPVG